MDVNIVRDICDKIKVNVSKVIVGKDEVVDLLLIALISSGHMLLEDVPGTGKTLLARTIAKSIESDSTRIQFTPDLLPSDLTGINFYNQKIGEFIFRPGPVFTNILLADEINRATPRTQSSLLECMEEGQVSIDGETRILEKPFMVIATQNPIETLGTFPLPEAQLDRFLLKTNMVYPSFSEGIDILKRFKSSNPLNDIREVTDKTEITNVQKIYSGVYVSDDILGYILRIADSTRNHPEIILGVSPRGTQAMLKAIQVRAILQGRDYCIPDDVKALVKPVFAHRMVIDPAAGLVNMKAEEILNRVLSTIPVPAEDGIK